MPTNQPPAAAAGQRTSVLAPRQDGRPAALLAASLLPAAAPRGRESTR